MKANELMIGDWVQSRGKIEQVTSLYDGYICTESFEDRHDYYFDPIPLTPEILEKNGFKKLRVSWILRDGMTVISLLYMKDKWSLNVSHEIRGKDEEGRADLVTFCRDWAETVFVHELQHALKDCKIEKEIKL